MRIEKRNSTTVKTFCIALLFYAVTAAYPAPAHAKLSMRCEAWLALRASGAWQQNTLTLQVASYAQGRISALVEIDHMLIEFGQPLPSPTPSLDDLLEAADTGCQIKLYSDAVVAIDTWIGISGRGTILARALAKLQQSSWNWLKNP